MLNGRGGFTTSIYWWFMSKIVNVVINPLPWQRSCAYKKGKKGRLGQSEASLSQAANNEPDTEPGPFSINASQVMQLSGRPVLTFYFTFNPSILGLDGEALSCWRGWCNSIFAYLTDHKGINNFCHRDNEYIFKSRNLAALCGAGNTELLAGKAESFGLQCLIRNNCKHKNRTRSRKTLWNEQICMQGRNSSIPSGRLRETCTMEKHEILYFLFVSLELLLPHAF